MADMEEVSDAAQAVASDIGRGSVVEGVLNDFVYILSAGASGMQKRLPLNTQGDQLSACITLAVTVVEIAREGFWADVDVHTPDCLRNSRRKMRSR